MPDWDFMNFSLAFLRLYALAVVHLPSSFQIQLLIKIWKDGTAMKKINLKDYYDHISTDTFIDIPDAVFNIFEEHRKAEQAYQSRIRTTKLTTFLTVVTVLNTVPCLFPSLPMRFTNASSQPSSSTLPLLHCRTSRQNAFMHTTFWEWVKQRLPKPSVWVKPQLGLELKKPWLT